MGNVKVIPDDAACTSQPQLWHRPRGKKISAEPLMDMVFKKPRLSGDDSCSFYQAIRAPPRQSDVDIFKGRVAKINANYGLSLYISAASEMRPTKVGPVPLGGFLSYQLAPTEGNFAVTHNLDFSREPADNQARVYPLFPLSLVPHPFTVTKCTPNQQRLAWTSLMQKQNSWRKKQSLNGIARDGGLLEKKQINGIKFWRHPQQESRTQSCIFEWFSRKPTSSHFRQ